MKNSLEIRLGMFVALTLLTAFILLEMVGNNRWIGETLTVKALFADIQELKVGDPVKMAGVRIGRVQGIGFAEDRVEVTLRIQHDNAVKTSSRAAVKFAGLMGQHYVSVGFGDPGSPPIEDQSVLASLEQPDLSSLMARVDSLAVGMEDMMDQFSAEHFSNILGPFTDFLQANRNKLDEIITNARLVSTQVADGQGSVGQLIMNDDFYATAMNTVANMDATFVELKTTVESAKGLVDNMKSGQGTLGRLATDASLYQETQTALTQLKEVLTKINGGQGSIGVLVNDKSFIDNAKLTLQKVDKATETLEDQGPLSVLGLAVNSLF